MFFTSSALVSTTVKVVGGVNIDSENAWSIKTLTTNVGCEAEELIREAERRWGGPPNPFSQLLKRRKAMNSLTKILSQFYEGE